MSSQCSDHECSKHKLQTNNTENTKFINNACKYYQMSETRFRPKNLSINRIYRIFVLRWCSWIFLTVNFFFHITFNNSWCMVSLILSFTKLIKKLTFTIQKKQKNLQSRYRVFTHNSEYNCQEKIQNNKNQNFQ